MVNATKHYYETIRVHTDTPYSTSKLTKKTQRLQNRHILNKLDLSKAMT
jgi:hypothetical protein